METWSKNGALMCRFLSIPRWEAIDWSEKHVGVETAKGTLRGRCLLTTVSNGILAARHIRFEPGFPDWKVDAIEGLPTGAESKVGVHFDKDIFGPDGRGAYFSWTGRDEVAEVEASVMGLNVAIVFSSGRRAAWLEEQGQQAGHDFAVNRIADVFGNDIRKSVTRSIVSAWTRDPWTLGSYSYALPGQSHQRKELARPIDDKVFFAGEATMKDSLGNLQRGIFVWSSCSAGNRQYAATITLRFNRRWNEDKLFYYLTRRAVDATPLPYHRLIAEPIG